MLTTTDALEEKILFVENTDVKVTVSLTKKEYVFMKELSDNCSYPIETLIIWAIRAYKENIEKVRKEME